MHAPEAGTADIFLMLEGAHGDVINGKTLDEAHNHQGEITACASPWPPAFSTLR
jgi:hypothetical protein